MTSYCFILGAGFSRAYSKQAPLMSDFLKVARDRGLYHPEGRHKTLANLASTYFGSVLNANIESLASSLAAKREMFPPLEARDAAYADLVEVIQGTLNGIYENPVDASARDVFSKFAEALVRLRNKVVVITLNYDLLMDQLLRDTNEWFPIDGLRLRSSTGGFFFCDQGATSC
jgi:hypothetical protein